MKFPLYFLILSTILLNACTNKDEKFCECLKASEIFEAINRDVLKGNRNENTIEKAKTLKKKKEIACADYLLMDGKEMLKKKKVCLTRGE
jgi:hypothetical protein